jgi:hypothetical protein
VHERRLGHGVCDRHCECGASVISQSR